MTSQLSHVQHVIDEDLKAKLEKVSKSFCLLHLGLFDSVNWFGRVNILGLGLGFR